jgi:cytoskeleton protein RodZ
MADANDDTLVAPQAGGIGEELRAAREAQGLSIDQVAAETRIPARHLSAIEAEDFAALPARTYAIGFTRTYARSVGLDSTAMAERVRAELDAQEPQPQHRPATFEPGDPARVPSRGLVWLVVAALVLLLVGGFFFMRTLFAPAAQLPSLIEAETGTPAEAPGAAAPPAATAPEPAGPVVFTAREEAWVRFYTPQGTLSERLLAPGESYTVPADAEQPMLRTGRPDALRITIGGREVPPLSQEQRVMSDVPVSAEALRARDVPQPAVSPTT